MFGLRLWSAMQAVMMGLLLTIITVFFSKAMLKPSVVSFDKAFVVKQFVSQLSTQNLSKEETQRLSEKFARALKTSIDEYAAETKTTVIKQEMVFATNSDVTPLIALRIAKKMRANS